jgi:hypothetical protein
MACGVVPAAMKSMISRYDGIAALLIVEPSTRITRFLPQKIDRSGPPHFL